MPIRRLPSIHAGGPGSGSGTGTYSSSGSNFVFSIIGNSAISALLNAKSSHLLNLHSNTPHFGVRRLHAAPPSQRLSFYPEANAGSKRPVPASTCHRHSCLRWLFRQQPFPVRQNASQCNAPFSWCGKPHSPHVNKSLHFPLDTLNPFACISF